MALGQRRQHPGRPQRDHHDLHARGHQPQGTQCGDFWNGTPVKVGYLLSALYTIQRNRRLFSCFLLAFLLDFAACENAHTHKTQNDALKQRLSPCPVPMENFNKFTSQNATVVSQAAPIRFSRKLVEQQHESAPCVAPGRPEGCRLTGPLQAQQWTLEEDTG